MNFEQTKQYIMAKPEAVENFPFGPDVSVFKVKHKMFATLSMGRNSEFHWLNLKCDPNEALMLRDMFTAVIPGYHMNKKHWNTVILDGSIPEGEVQRMIDNSFMLVVGSMLQADRQSIELAL